jgi:hypothetical protein
MSQCTISINNKERTINVPFTIGNQTTDDIYIYDMSIGKNKFHVVKEKNYLVSYDSSGKKVDLSSISDKYNFKVLGVFSEDSSAFEKFLAREAQITSNLPWVFKMLLVFGADVKLRSLIFSTYFLIAFMIFYNTEHLSKYNKEIKSNEVKLLQHGMRDNKGYNVGYDHGVVFEIYLNSHQMSVDAHLDFLVGGLYKKGSIVILVNKYVVYISPALSFCSDIPCDQQAILKSKHLKQGVNKIAVIHTDPGKAWLFARLKFENFVNLNEVEKRQIGNYIDSVEERYSERYESPFSVIIADRYLKKISRITKKKFVPRELDIEIRLLKKRIKGFLKVFLNDYWFSVDKLIKLNKLEDAMDKLTELSGYFPDSSSKVGRRIEKQINQLQAYMGASNE